MNWAVPCTVVLCILGGANLWAIDYSQYHGQATIIYNDEKLECKVISVSDDGIKITCPKFNSGYPSLLKPALIQEAHFAHDKLVWDKEAKTFVSAAGSQIGGRVQVINHTGQTIQIVVTGFRDSLGDDQEIDQLRDPNASVWQFPIAADATQYIDPDGKPLTASLLKYDVLTGDGRTHQIKEYESGSAGGAFSIPVERSDLHKPKIVELTRPWQFNQGNWTLSKLEGTYSDNTTASDQASIQAHGSASGSYRGARPAHPHNGAAQSQAQQSQAQHKPIQPPIYIHRPAQGQVQSQYEANISGQTKVQSSGNHEINTMHGNATGLGNITGSLRNPENKTLAVTATITIVYHDSTDAKKLVTRTFVDTLRFAPNENKSWIIPAPGTNATTEGTVTDFDLSTEVVSN